MHSKAQPNQLWKSQNSHHQSASRKYGVMVRKKPIISLFKEIRFRIVGREKQPSIVHIWPCKDIPACEPIPRYKIDRVCNEARCAFCHFFKIWFSAERNCGWHGLRRRRIREKHPVMLGLNPLVRPRSLSSWRIVTILCCYAKWQCKILTQSAMLKVLQKCCKTWCYVT